MNKLFKGGRVMVGMFTGSSIKSSVTALEAFVSEKMAAK